MSDRLLIVIGSGPGIGVATASLFASKGFNIALLARNADRLKEDQATVRKASQGSSTKVQTYTVDVVEHENLKKTLDQVKQDLGSPEIILYNAARVAKSSIGDESPESVVQDFRIINTGCYVAASWAIPVLEAIGKEKSDSRPGFFITGGGLWEYPLPDHFSLSMQKAAQVNFAGSLEHIAKPKNIHVATVNVGGVVDDSDPVINAKNIASKYWGLYQEDKKDWQSMVNVGDFRDMLK